jgi:hypothetical protein
MAEDLGLTKQGLLIMIDRLIVSEFLIKHPETKFLKPTDKWNGVYFEKNNPQNDDNTDGKESLPPVNKVDFIGKESLPVSGKQSLLDGGKESLPYINTAYSNTSYKEKEGSSGENFSELVFAEFRRQKTGLPQTALIDEVNLFAKKYNGRDVANLASLVKSWISKVDWSRYAEPPTSQDKPTPKKHMEFDMISEVTRDMWPKKTNMECGNLSMMIARRYSGQKFDNPKQVLIDLYKAMQRPDYVDKVKMTYAAILNEVKFNTNAATEPWQRYVADKIHEKWGEHVVESFEELIQSWIYDAKNKKSVFATQ